MSLASPIPLDRPARAAGRLVLPTFAAALFTSALLLFGVQPMFAKMVLPILGGSPGVWSVATVVFQCLLVAGYAYAHWLAGRSARTGLLVHLAVMTAATLTMPIAVAPGWTQPPTGFESLWLVGLMAVSIGLPFFAVAGNGPLLQAWFARTGHAQARDPYFLYGASNLGSFAALAAYPLLVEPALSVPDQTRLWQVAFTFLMVLVAGAGLLARGGPALPAEAASPGPTLARMAGWAAIGAIPSGLLVSVTAHLSTDVAATPLLWVVPLALYLLSFVIAFRASSRLADAPSGLLQVGLAAIVIAGLGTAGSPALGLGSNLGLFALTCLVCHRGLYRMRPPSAHLTRFYLSLSIGGAAGGLFCAIAAPLLFSSVLEYPILLVAAVLCRPPAAGQPFAWPGRPRISTLALALGILALALLALALGAPDTLVGQAAMGGFIVVMITRWRSRSDAAVAAAFMVLAAATIQSAAASSGTVRSFFGVHKIATSSDGRFRLLSHGTTAHGAIRLRNDDGTLATGRPEPTTYYTMEGVIGTAVRSVRAARGGSLGATSVVGLGTGSLACHRQAGEAWTFYEIDHEVVRIARDPSLFRFLSECGPDLPVVLGDARLTLATAPAAQDLIVLDAFSSDAIPLHLLTREAIGLYLSRLGPEGALVMHVSNRYLDLRQVLARAAAEHGLTVLTRTDRVDEPFDRRLHAPAMVVAMAREARHLGPIAADPAWARVPPDMTRRPWTDDYSNVLEALGDALRR